MTKNNNQSESWLKSRIPGHRLPYQPGSRQERRLNARAKARREAKQKKERGQAA